MNGKSNVVFADRCHSCPVQSPADEAENAGVPCKPDHFVSRFRVPRSKKDYNSGDTVFMEGDDFSGLYCLEEGMVALKKFDVNGANAVVRVVRPGELFGYRSFLINEAHKTTAEALCPSRLCFVPRSRLQRLVNEKPEAMQALVKNLGQEMDGIEHLFMLTVTKSVRSRFAHFLLGLASRYEDGEGDIMIHLPIHKKEIAGILGIAVESLSRIIAYFQGQGIIEDRKKKIIIRNKQALLDLIK